jgi:hypothetical protein
VSGPAVTARAERAPARPPSPADATPLARKAALLLHALGERDRQWLIDQLSEAERGAVQGLVGELRALGIPPDPGLLDEVADGRRPPGDGSDRPSTSGAPPRQDVGDDPRSGSSSLLALDRADLALLAGILRDEPPGLVATLLAARSWPWRQALLQHLDFSHRRQVEEQLRRSGRLSAAGAWADAPAPAAPALLEHLTATLSRRLEASRGAPRAGDSLRAAETGSERSSAHVRGASGLARLFGRRPRS